MPQEDNMSHKSIKPLKGARDAVGFMVTANDLFSGEVLYLAGPRTWSSVPEEGLILSSFDEAQTHAAQSNLQEAGHIVGAYVVGLTDERLLISFKERVRATGPTHYFHGKQQNQLTAQKRP